ncbi:MAG: hypothetical protein ACOCYP_03675 [Planctomycetota bacterium]
MLPLNCSAVLVLALIVVICWAAGDDDPWRVGPGDTGVIRHFLRHGATGGTGTWTGTPVAIDPECLEPGDILLGARPGSPYGYWTHVALCLEPDLFLGQDLHAGFYLESLEQLLERRGIGGPAYQHVKVMRVRCDPAVRRRAAAYGRTMLCTTFHTMAHKRDPRIATCATAVWKAYAREGIDLVPQRTLLVPSDFASGESLEPVLETGAGPQ